MELTDLISDLPLCRLCAQENINGTELFASFENEPNLSELVNKYLPLKVENDGKFPTKICPGCNIQLEATISFMDLIVEGQLKLRQLYKLQQDKLHRQEKQRQQLEEALKSVNPSSSVDTYTIQSDETGEKFLIQIFSQGPLFPSDHELTLKAEGLTRPRRKRGRPPKASQSTKEVTLEEKSDKVDESDEVLEDGKRKRKIKVPTRYSEAIQGKELDKVFKQEGVIDEDSMSDGDDKLFENVNGATVEEVIGRLETENGEDLGQPIVINRGPVRTKFRNRIGKVFFYIKVNTKVASSNHTKRKRRFQCEICGKEFLHPGRYQVHKNSHQLQYKCGQASCEFQASDKAAFDEHQKQLEHSGHSVVENVYNYGVLNLSVPVAADNPPTNTIQLPKKETKCKICDKSFSCKQNYEVHLKAVHGGERPHICQFCHRRFSYLNCLRVHMLQHYRKSEDPNGQYKCPSCPKSFRHPSSLQYHKESEHTSGRRFVCNKCNKSFKHRQLLQRHQTVHSSERPYRCTQCSSAFKSRANLIHHGRTVHSGQRSHWCSQCDKAFAHKTALKLHQRWHSGIRPYQCEFCKKTFSQKGNLIEHKRIHTGEKPYQCDYCGRSFTTSSQFRLHKKRHLDERPHRCDFCQKTFLNKVTLRCHMRRHLDERPFKCSHCSKTFPEAWTLRKHERVHTGERPYKCQLCPKAFADSSNLTKHRKIHRNMKDKQMVFVTYEKDSRDAIVTYIEQQDTVAEPQTVLQVSEDVGEMKTIQLQQLIDPEGNPISFLTQDGQHVKVVTSNEDGQENIQGLLPDGTLVPISLTTVPEKKSLLEDTSQKLDPPIEGQLLPTDIQFLPDDKIGNNIQFVSEDNQNMCLVTTYSIEDSINPQYLSMP